MNFLIIFLLFFLSGCFSSKNLNSAIPNWYINAPQNTSKYLYGVSDDYSLKGAKVSALNNMATRLIVNVSSTLNKNTHSTKSSYTKDVSQNINLEVEKIKFTNAKVAKSKLINNQFFIIMEVNRQDLFKQNLKTFKLLDSKIDKQTKQLDLKSRLEQVNKLQNLYPKLIKAKKLSYILYAINNNFDYSSYISKYDNLIDNIQALKDRIVVYVKEDKDGLFKEEFIDLLNKNSFKVSSNNPDVFIKLKNKIIHSKYKGWYIVKITTTISVANNNKNINNNIIHTIGKSGSNKKNAIENARINFKNKITQRGLDSILFNK
ncbi:hypothetical protein MNB_ARC-1_40 [hydrothermal vent metagenome]|uniref:Lipoprotein LPP20-like domain-containing protein n=1 Tax=hydrothermal vent metagenome TaxID=652676 RepID=A0A3B1DRV9_9ZZZZ